MSDTASLAVTDDAFLGDALEILQPKAGYRAGIDAVLLAATAQPGARTVLDAGSGVGVVGLCVARRLADARVTLLERERELVTLAQDNIARNALSERVQVVQGDIVGRTSDLQERIAHDSFDVVLANPPFHLDARGTMAASALKAAAHSMDESALDLWVRFAARVTRPGGVFTLIHKADAIASILAAFGSRFGGIKVKPIHARKDEPAIRVIVQGIKGSRAPAEIRPPLILHAEGNAFLPDVVSILRDGAPLAI